MQIFALFMLCGTLVSFLVPETKGRTLEEMSGEPPTTLDHRNGSVTLNDGFKGWAARNNPFKGGAPAGFTYMKSPNLGPRSPGILGKRERVGIMTSPELIPRRGGTGHGRAASETSTEGNGYNISVGSNGTAMRADENDDLYLASAGAGNMPRWGAGWGVQSNIERRREGRVESIKLHDVGKLLK
jgi:PHS family inorganic phosphate transporter-like MFS transporter